MIGRGVAVIVASLAAACSAAEARRAFEIGEHRGDFVVPAGWTAVDQGRQVRLKRESQEIVLQALGPAGPNGVQQEIERARSAWRLGQRELAATRLGQIDGPGRWFPDGEARGAFYSAWRTMADRSASTPSVDIEAAFAAALTALSTIEPPEIGAVADVALLALGHDQRRDVGSRTAIVVGGRNALVVETWNRLSHADPRTFVFIEDDGYLMALYPMWVEPSESVGALEVVRDSLQLAPSTWRQ